MNKTWDDVEALEARVKKLEDTSVMFKYDNPLAGKVSPMGSGQITDEAEHSYDNSAELKKRAGRIKVELPLAKPAGVWVTIDHLNNRVYSAYATEVEALRAGVSLQVRVGFLDFETGRVEDGNQSFDSFRG